MPIWSPRPSRKRVGSSHDSGHLTKQDRLPGQTKRTRFYVVKDAILGHTEDDDPEDAA